VKFANVEDGLPFDDCTFDVVNAGEVLEHLYDTKLFFQEAARVLKREGILLFTVPNLNSLENRLKVLRGAYLGMAGAYPEDHFGSHVRMFNLSKIRELCARTGFALEDVRGIPALEARGRWVDLSLGVAGRVLPGFSKVLMGRARKTSV
jgi:2-polyprenyl-3-methyl-5-hydroxy-6-metoxy-1,4-benzoquinol methylase